MSEAVSEAAPILLHIDPHLIDIPDDRLRAVDPEKVSELAASFSEIGQLQPIEVFPAGANGRYRLNVGAHRVTAAIEAKLPTIMALAYEGTADQRRLREIDENLYRAELSPYDQATFLAERRAIYERLNGPVRRGPRSRDVIATNLSQLSFFDDVTAKFRLPRRMVQRALSRKNLISPDVWHRLRGHPITKSASELDKLMRLNEAQQRQVVRLIMQETLPAKNVTAALRAMSDAPVESVDDKQFRVLSSAWAKAGTKARADFLNFLKTQGFTVKTDKASN